MILYRSMSEYIETGIHVILANGDTGNVSRDTLNHMIRRQEVVAFHRSEGWGQIGRDPIRNTQRPQTRSGKRRDDFPPKRSD
jgi:hypothetical protein